MSSSAAHPGPGPGRDLLRSLGVEVSELDPAQVEVLDGLSDEEVAVLREVRRRLADAEPDVVAHSATVGGLFF